MRVMDKPVGDYVKTYRSLLNWEWYHDLPVRVLFQHMMLEANWLPGRFEGQDIPPGSFPTSTDRLAEKSGLTRQSVRTALDKLKSTNEITIRTTKRFTVVTLANWDKYQGEGARATHRSTQRATAEQHASNTRSTTIEEGKKERREEKKEARALSIADRRAAFVAACKSVVDADPTRLDKPERGPFTAYWTETNERGRMRFEDEKFFDHGRRMDTWQKRALTSPRSPAAPVENPNLKSYRV